ncbi:MAG: cupin domain-containing protein [Saprospiraceae bacterium]|nr:cupin domain-containing protein [Saprospiraceae bacterium]
MKPINILEKLSLFTDHWSPKIVGELNGQQVKLAKLKGEFVWHKHDKEDELFFVINGILKIEFRDKTVEIHPGEFIIVPRGIEHKPVAISEEVCIMLFEPNTTLNTGDTLSELRVEQLDWI